MSDVSKESGLQLKGTNLGIKVIFPEELKDDELLKAFEAVPEEAYTLPMGRGIVLDFKARQCSEKFITRILNEVVWPKNLNVLAWLTAHEGSSRCLERAGFRVAEPVAERTGGTGPDLRSSQQSLILNNSLRSGQREEHGSDIVLVGHLHDGAELFAGGSVFVFGRLKGLVHAGCNGTKGVCVVTASFEARQLRLGGNLCDQLGSDMKWWKKPVIITLEDDGLLFKEWTYQ